MVTPNYCFVTNYTLININPLFNTSYLTEPVVYINSTGVASPSNIVAVSTLDYVYNVSFSVNVTLSSGGNFTCESGLIYIDCIGVVNLTNSTINSGSAVLRLI